MPYAPGITYQPIQADMSGWGRALMQIMGQKDAKAEQAKKEAQEFKTYVAMGKQIGLNPDELTTADLGTVKGMVEGKITQTNLERAVAEFQKMQREGKSQDALTQAVSRAGQKQVNVPAFQIPGQPLGMIMPEMTATGSQPMTSQSLLDAIAKNPQAANSPEALSFLEALQRGEDPTRVMFAEANRMNAEANVMDARRRMSTPAAAEQQIPPVPETDPAEGWVWTYDGKNWRQSQQRAPVAPGKGGKTGGRKAVTSQAEYDALPAGAEYLDPQGNIRRKN